MNLPINFLILCSGNSARSLLGEALLRHHSRGRWHAYSAGSQPLGEPHPMALQILRENNVDTTGLRSKSWNEFAEPGAPRLDVVITVCDNAADEMCPVWYGAPITVFWGIADPAAVGDDIAAQHHAFTTAYRVLRKRVEHIDALDVATLDATDLRPELAKLTHVF